MRLLKLLPILFVCAAGPAVAGPYEDALTAAQKGDARAPGYAWASPDASRIGINLRWVQGSCSKPTPSAAP